MNWPLSVAGTGVLALFVLTYVLIAWKEEHRTLITGLLGVGAVGIAVAAGAIPLGASGACEIFGYHPTSSPWAICSSNGFVSWDTVGLLFGLFILAALLSELRFFSFLAFRLARLSRGRPLPLFLILSTLSFVLAAFINSITVMVVLASLTLELSQALGMSPIPYLLAEISCANVGGASTFVGDPPNVILGTYFNLNFTDFLVYAAPLALASLGVTLLLFWWRSKGELFQPRELAGAKGEGMPSPPPLDRTRVSLAFGAFTVTLALLAFNRYIPPSVGEIGLIGAALGLGVAGPSRARSLLRDVDWSTLAFFVFLFLLVGGLEATGVIGLLAQGLGDAGAGNVLITASLLLWVLGLLSSVVDNVPLAAAAAPIIASLGKLKGLPIGSLVYATAVGTDVGGNGTPVGASANVTGLALARRAGIQISWKRYLKDAFPIMLASLAAANVVLFFYH